MTHFEIKNEILQCIINKNPVLILEDKETNEYYPLLEQLGIDCIVIDNISDLSATAFNTKSKVVYIRLSDDRCVDEHILAKNVPNGTLFIFRKNIKVIEAV